MAIFVEDKNRRLVIALTGTTGSIDTLNGRNHDERRIDGEEEELVRGVYRRRADEDIPANFAPRYMEDSTDIPEYRMTKDVPRPLFPRRQLSHAIVLCIENVPKPLFSFRIAVLFLSFLPITLIYRLSEQLQTCTNMVRALVRAQGVDSIYSRSLLLSSPQFCNQL